MHKRKWLKTGRAALWCALVCWVGAGIVMGWTRTMDLMQLHRNGKLVNAQVIGLEPMPAGERNGWVHYAFNEGHKAVDSKIQVPVAAYSEFYIGRVIPVTFLPTEPHV